MDSTQTSWLHHFGSVARAARPGTPTWSCLTRSFLLATVLLGADARARTIWTGGDDPGTPPPPPAAAPTGETVPPPASAQPAPAAVATPAEPQDDEPETQLTLLDGRKISGFLIRQDDTRIYLRVAGIESPFPRTDIVRTEVLPPVLQRYREMRAAIADGDADRLILLAEWLRTRGKYNEAMIEVETALKIEPNHRSASDLKILIAKQRDMAAKAKAKAASPDKTAAPEAPAAADAARQTKNNFPLLSPEDVNIIRVYEVDLKAVPRMVISRELVEELLKTHAAGVLEALRDRFTGTDLMRLIARKGNDVEAFRDNEVVAAIASLPASSFLEIMFDSRVRARELYSKVRVIEDPASMKIFRESVQTTWLHNNCATSKCHGGEEAGRLWLATRQPNSDATVYTNFLILNNFKLADGTPLIDLAKPEASPLLQMGLLRKLSKFPHPLVPRGTSKVDAWRPVFRETSERRYQEAVQWINALYRPRPEYPVKYEPPVSASAKASQTKHSTNEAGR